MTEVATVKLPYVQAFTDRHGKTRFYYRRAGFKRVSLPGEPGSVEFASAYESAGQRITFAPKEGPRSIGAAIAAYYRSEGFRNLQPTSQRDYRRILERFREAHGHRAVHKATPEALDRIFAAKAQTFPTAALTLRKRLSPVFRLAVKAKWIKANPIHDTDKIRHKSDGFRPWDDDDIELFTRFWPSGTRERMALALLLCTGQRRSDVARMGRQHIKDGRIMVRQQKTRRWVWVRIHPFLQAELDQAPADQMTLVLTQYGKPFTAEGFTQWFVERAEKAGLKGLTPHGLRKACGRRLAEAGCTASEIAAILGHKSLQMVQQYTESADTMRLADSAMDRLERVENEKRQTPVSNRSGSR